MTCIALLRGVNVGGKTVAMADVCALFTRLALSDPQSLLASGNLVFRSRTAPTLRLEQKLEAETKKQLSLETVFFLRTAEEWRTLVARNPFRAEAARDPGRLVLMALKDAPGNAAAKAVEAAIVGREVVHADGRHLYIVYPDGQGRSRLTNVLIEKTLGTRGTARNWNTVLRLEARVKT